MKEVIIDTLIDSIKLLPFLFIAFLLIELFEHKFSKKTKNKLSKSNRLGPVIGSILGIIPQCGFSVMATNLYATRIITLGTLIAVYLSTSDEMIPILIAEKAPISLLIKILLIKLVVGIIFGIIIDLLIKRKDKENYHICEDDHCNCDDEHFLKAALKHTFNIFIFILICTLIINAIMEYGGNTILNKILLKNNIFAPFLTSLIGLIPNCAASVILTELYLNSAITFAALVSGLLTGAGLGILVLFRTNKNKKENIKILLTIYVIGVLVGLLLEIFI
ncbi:MAG: arsenic efflux protein [Bacilli bacterium]|nr:arsenic efflux protein [Bacilli bacterium]